MIDTYRLARRMQRGIKQVPMVRSWQERSYERVFASDEGYSWFRGVYASFAQALRAAPKNRPLGFDLPAYAQMFDERQTRIYSYDYPVLFWLKPLLLPGVRVFDFGGHVGLQFYSYQRYLRFPEGAQWQVCDVTAVVERGRALARERGVPEGLTFSTGFHNADGADVLIAAGSLQFVEGPSLAESLASLASPPRHLLLNKVPLGDCADFVTLQNAGTSFVPYHVYERKAFTSGLVAAGYEIVDEWEDRVHSCLIPFHHDHDVPHHSGLYLRLATAAEPKDPQRHL